MNTKVLRNLSYGVYVVSTLDNTRPTGCTANSVMQITSTPATIAVSINHDNYTNQCILKSGKFAVSILSEQSDPSIIGTFGFKTGKDTNKFDNVEYETVENMPIVKDSCGYIVCKVINKMETATHTIFLGEIIEGDTYDSAAPMTYAYYHKVIKGKSPKNAPTYIPEEDKIVEKQGKKKRYVCQVCGYVYEGEIPDNFICPICGQGRDKFVLVED